MQHETPQAISHLPDTILELQIQIMNKFSNVENSFQDVP